ncbi:hypothetical protein EES43_09215 [Streptomyces sp. ADI96-02]|nr:hypothetical protein EES43_09215 [Streptomyces sp. ADI96-02]
MNHRQGDADTLREDACDAVVEHGPREHDRGRQDVRMAMERSPRLRTLA